MSEEIAPNKKQKNLYLTAEATRLLSRLAKAQGISEASAVELMIREKAKIMGVSDETPK